MAYFSSKRTGLSSIQDSFAQTPKSLADNWHYSRKSLVLNLQHKYAPAVNGMSVNHGSLTD